MVATGKATPLIGLDALVIDTETTGLDASKARLVEIAAVRRAATRSARSGASTATPTGIASAT
jgi:DNA polymerase III alpha subunit (gram-positive type)